MTIATLYGQGTVPRQMRQLYKQYKRGQLSLDNTNTIRYITAIPGMYTKGNCGTPKVNTIIMYRFSAFLA